MKVRIYKPSKNAMQSGRAKARLWYIEPELQSARTPEPLMGWTSSEDTLNQIRLKFESADAAVQYAERQGWEYSFDAEQIRRVVPRNFADNFRVRKKA